MVRTRRANVEIERHNTSTLDGSVLRELSQRYYGDFSRIISELPGIALGTIINALNDPSLSDVKVRIVQKTSSLTN